MLYEVITNAFEFVKNEWVFIRDIDLRNPKLPNR